MPDLKEDILKSIDQLLDRKLGGINNAIKQLTERVDNAIAETSSGPDKLDIFAKEMIDLVKDVTSEMHSLKDSQARLLDATSQTILQLMPDRVYLRRFLSDRYQEKFAVAHRVAMTKFSRSASGAEPIRCFVQASTTAQHLAHHLVHHPNLNPSSLIYSNSAVVPLVLLYGRAQLNIWPFCGSEFDPECGGWLFRPNDSETRNELEKLFRRPPDKHPLTVALLMPMAITADQGLFYTRQSTVLLAEMLSELASEIIVMVPSNRVFQSGSDLPGTDPLWPLASQNWSDQARRKVTVVSAGIEHPLPQLAQSFASAGVKFEYFDTTGNDWINVPA